MRSAHTHTLHFSRFHNKINDYKIFTYAHAHADTEIAQHQIDHTCFAFECGLTPDLLFFRLSHQNQAHTHTLSAFWNNFWRSLIFNNYRHITVAG